MASSRLVEIIEVFFFLPKNNNNNYRQNEKLLQEAPLSPKFQFIADFFQNKSF